MRIFLYFLGFILLFLGSHQLYSQEGFTSPTIQDLYSKKVGNLRLSSLKFDLGIIKNNEIIYDTIRLYNSGSLPIHISLPLKMPLFMKVNIKGNPIQAGGRGFITMYYDASKKNDFGFVLDRIQLNTDDLIQPQKYISVSATIEENFPLSSIGDTITIKSRIPEVSYSYGILKQGEKASHIFKIYNDGRKKLLLHKIKSNNVCLKATFSKKEILAGDSAIILAEFDSSGKLGIDSRIFSLYTNNPNQPEVKFEMKGVVIK